MQVSNDDVLNALFAQIDPDQRAVLCSVAKDPSTAAYGKWHGIPWQPGERSRLNQTWNNYVAISSFKAFDFGDGRVLYRRRKDQFGAMHALMIDDVGTKLSLEVLPQGLVPSLVVETSPGNFQVTYFLDRPLLDQEQAEDGIRQIIQKLTNNGADPGMAGVTRVLRLPEGINGKPKHARDGHAWVCNVRVWRPDARTSWDELRREFGIVRHFRNYVEPMDAVMRERMRGFNIVKQGLRQLRLIKRESRGWIDIRCPWIDEHTDRADSGSAVNPPDQKNGWYGGFKCHHGHCEQRNWGDLEHEIGRRIVENGRKTRGPFV